MRTLIVAVGRLRPPYQDDVQHYRKMLARYAKLLGRRCNRLTDCRQHILAQNRTGMSRLPCWAPRRPLHLRVHAGLLGPNPRLLDILQ